MKASCIRSQSDQVHGRRRPIQQDKVDLKLFGSLLALEVGLLVGLLAAYRINYKPDMVSFVSSPPGWVFLFAVLQCVASGRYIISTVGASASQNPAIYRAMLLNAVLVGGIGVAAEAVTRHVAVTDLAGQHIGRLLLRPRPWHAVVQRYNAMLDAFESNHTFFVFDPFLGWTVGDGRRSADGLMQSSQGGMRVSMAADIPGPARAGCKVAIVGDSFALAEGIAFEETWGAYLERYLPSDCQVLNFGVSGYSIGQMHLRFKRDVLPLRPDVLIIAFTDGALSRTMGVYGFLMMTEGEWPWPQPRFAIRNGQLSAINLPLPAPRNIFAATSIRDVPFISYDRWYLPSEWEQPYWGIAYVSYAFRYLTSIYPLYDVDRPEVSDQSLLEVNTALLQAMRDNAVDVGVLPIVLYLPKRDDYREPRRLPLTPELVKGLQIPFVDATPCVEEIPLEERWLLTNYHYSRISNDRVAKCVLPEVLRALVPSRTESGHANG